MKSAPRLRPPEVVAVKSTPPMHIEKAVPAPAAALGTASPRTIRVCHSPDSDDAFMFYALAEGKVDTEGITYVHELQDIETLNQRALRGELDVTAVSI